MAIGGILLSLLAPRVSISALSRAPSSMSRFVVAGIAAFLTIAPLTVGARDSRILPHRRGTRPAHRHPRHASPPVDRQSATRSSKSASAPASAISSATFHRSSPRLLKSSLRPPACFASPESSSRTSPSKHRLNQYRTLKQSRRPLRQHSIRTPQHSVRRSSSHPSPHSSGSTPPPSSSSRTPPILKAGTWQGSAHLWANGFIHLGAALLSAFLLRRRGLSVVLASAVGALAFACLLLLDPARAITASVFYPIGVSMYSVALVAYPSLLSPARSNARARPPGRLDLCHRRLDRLRPRHRHGPEPRPRAARVCLPWLRSWFCFRSSSTSFATVLVNWRSPPSYSSSLSSSIALQPSAPVAASPHCRRTRPPRLYLRRLHPLPLAVCPPQHRRRAHVGTG